VVAVVERVGTVAELHALDPFADTDRVEPAIWWCRPIDDAIVLGSRQTDALVDRGECLRAGLSIVRRRSGGGAVLMRRHSVVWIDVVLPVGFAPDDIRGSMAWIGGYWRDVLRSAGDRPLHVHDGGLLCSEWSDLVCFSGVGPGEVLDGDDKLVGLSQRRTRRGIRIQSLVYTESVAAEYAPLLVGELPATDPPGQAWCAEIDAEATAAALGRRLTPV